MHKSMLKFVQGFMLVFDNNDAQSTERKKKKQRRIFEMMLLLFLFEEIFISSLKILYTMF